MAEAKTRLDLLLVEKGLSSSPAQAQALIMSGVVIVDGDVVLKGGTQIKTGATLSVKGNEHPFVGRGGMKLRGALNHFCVSVNDKIAFDIGASTGGFTDCLLQDDAKKVYALDVGYGQIAWKLRTDARVVVIDRTNIRHFDAETLNDEIDIITIDTAFISLKNVIPKAVEIVKHGGEIIALIKPQFEVPKDMIGKGGIVRDEAVQAEAVAGIKTFATELGLDIKGVCDSPIVGHDGNKEFFIYLRRDLA